MRFLLVLIATGTLGVAWGWFVDWLFDDHGGAE